MAPALRPPDQVEPANGAVGRSIRHRRVALAGTLSVWLDSLSLQGVRLFVGVRAAVDYARA